MSERPRTPTANVRRYLGRAESFRAPDPHTFSDSFLDPVLSAYLDSVRQWHGYIRFLSLPHYRENPNVLLDRLYVEPSLADRPLSPDSDPKGWQKTDAAIDAVTEFPRLVVLGDPGSGKSTLVNWVAFNLARPVKSPLSERLGPLVPIPMVLREVPVGPGVRWDSLLEAFLGHLMCKPLLAHRHPTKLLTDLLSRGQAIILLDGLDEIGSVHIRRALRDAVLDGMWRFRRCRWLLTSRLVGYDEVPFHEAGNLAGFVRDTDPPVPEPDDVPSIIPPESEDFRAAELRYVAPFDDAQIERFARNWYVLREAAHDLAEQGSRQFLAAVHGHPNTLRLAHPQSADDDGPDLSGPCPPPQRPRVTLQRHRPGLPPVH